MASVRIPEQKIILCGEYGKVGIIFLQVLFFTNLFSGVGKSSIFRRYATNTFTTATDRASTLGLDHYEKAYSINERDIKLQLWDTGGMERIASVTSSMVPFCTAVCHTFIVICPFQVITSLQRPRF